MFGFLHRRKARQKQETVNNILRQFSNVYNAGPLTWKEVWGTLEHEKSYYKSDLDLSAIFCAMNTYTSSTLGLPRFVYRVDPASKSRARLLSPSDHPAARIFTHRANPDWSADDMLSTAVHDVLWHGNMYAVREYDQKGQTSRIYYVHPTRIPEGNIKLANGSEDLSTGRKARQGELIYVINTGTESESVKHEYMVLPASSMVHLKAPIIDNENFCGVGIRENAAKSLGLYRASENFGHKFYTRGISNQTFLASEHRLAPDVYERVKAQFDENPNLPLEEAFKLKILEQGLKPVNIGVPFQHLQFIETRAFSVEDVSRWFNIPAALLHSKMGRSGSEEASSEQISMFVQFGLGPLLTRVANQLRDELFPVYQQPMYEFQYDRIYLYRTVLTNLTVALRNLFEIGIFDRERIADILGTRIDIGDELNNQRYVPANLVTVEHSKAIEDKAYQAIQMGKVEIDRAGEELTRLKDSPSPAEVAEQQAQQEQQSQVSELDDMDESQDEQNQDKRLRGAASNAFRAAVESLEQYEAKVLNQKKESRPDDYQRAVEEFYARDGKFHNLLNSSLSCWSDVVSLVSEYDSVETLIENWISKGSNNE